MSDTGAGLTGIPLFSVKDLSMNFPSPGGGIVFQALRNISLEIYEGECLLIAGSNGSGKTVLMKILAGLLDPSGGEVLFRGRRLEDAGRELRRSVGLVFQDADSQILGETLEEDVAFGPKNLGLSREETAEKTETALRMLGLWEKRHAQPRRLSGGEKRRLAAAGILAMGCGLMILDEPFANLDWPGVMQVLKIIKSLKEKGETVVLLTHELEKALAFADRLIILHAGELRAEGKPEEVLERLESAWGVRDPRQNYAGVTDCTWLPP
ncbi:MAG: energy-coupling factor ABC transporter ATP-binding protein [Treponema sp.]|jgi:biotin transport system ATP-binding protein|nr:energy-coupling factor ABC transporter ATP-binding protein [Treponema sp.]